MNVRESSHFQTTGRGEFLLRLNQTRQVELFVDPDRGYSGSELMSTTQIPMACLDCKQSDGGRKLKQ
ncbi:hypothetical protein T265_15758, partial [Opisthorchis viverrini]